MKQIRLDKKKIKFLLFVVLMVTIFIGLLWWIFSPVKDTGAGEKKPGGLNTFLPGANLKKDSARDKLSFYAAALQDSVKRTEQMRMDPYRRESENIAGKAYATGYEQTNRTNIYAGSEVGAIESKIAAIQKRITMSNQQRAVVSANTLPISEPVEKVSTATVTPDPEMEAINGTLDKLLAIQQPKKTNAPKETSAYSVNSGKEIDTTYFGKRKKVMVAEGFFADSIQSNHSNSTLTATISNEQVLQSGSTVKLDLGSAIEVGGKYIPAGTALFGLAFIEAERLRIHISSIRYQNDILPVSLEVYDMDGMEGIYAPGSAVREVVKESADGATQSGGTSPLGLSFSSQTAAAGIGVAKKLLSKKVKQVRVTVAAGYRVLLRDHKQMGN